MWNSRSASPACKMDGYGPLGRESSPIHELDQFRHAYPSTSASLDGTYARRCHPTRQFEDIPLGTYTRRSVATPAPPHDSITAFNHPRCAPQSPPHSRRPLLNFPPPPTYPPPHPVREDCCLIHKPSLAQRHCLDLPGVPGPSGIATRTHHHSHQSPSSWRGDEEDFFPNSDYSYAYYEPGPPTRHLNVPTRHPISGNKSLDFFLGDFSWWFFRILGTGEETHVSNEVRD